MTVDAKLGQDEAVVPRAQPGSGRTRFIPEIQGLRTLALVLVVVYHVWFHRVSGGVDVFLLVSAFLMTSSVIAATRDGRGFNPLAFLVRRFGRLLPLAGAVIALTMIVALLIFPVWRWGALLEDGWASLFYVENLLLQDRATNYYSADLATQSPNQHFWSLSIQGQVFVLWAVAHAVALGAAKLTRTPVRVWLLIGFGALFVVSLAFSVWMTDASQERAYFDVRARLWEFALGSLLALIGPVRMPRAISHALTYLGVALIAVCGFVLPVGSTFPGYAALWPLGGAALILLACSTPSSTPTVLAHPWLVRAGAYSYALYLTHWPILVLAQTITNTGELSFVAGTGVLISALLVSIALVHLIENPLARFQRNGSLWRSGLVVASIVGVIAVGILGVRPYVEARAATDAGVQASQSWAVLGEECAPDVVLAEYCSSAGTGLEGAPKVTFLGSSHMQQYMSAFMPTVEREGWQAEAYLLPGCQFRTTLGDGREETCYQAWEEARSGDMLADTDVLVILGSVSSAEGDSPLVGLESFIEDVRSSGTEVITVRDNPRFEDNIFACGEQLGHDDPQCTVELGSSWAEPLSVPSATATVDLTTSICPGFVCSPLQDGSYVFLDDNHLTSTFATELNDVVDSTLVEVMSVARS